MSRETTVTLGKGKLRFVQDGRLRKLKDISQLLFLDEIYF
jgi:hypothetical protein